VIEFYCNIFVASFHLTNTNTGNYISNEGAIQLAEALKCNTSLTKLNLTCNRLCAASVHSHNTGNRIDNEGAVMLSEALKANTTLASLNLSSNKLLASFYPHSTQGMMLVMKES
jgi:hypothetical protein